MAEFICDRCGTGFKRGANRNRAIRFCGQSCYHAWRKESGNRNGCFEKGSEPWNAGQRGVHLSPASEFKPGGKSPNLMPVGSVAIRTRLGVERAWLKVGKKKWRPRATVVWERRYGTIPTGCIIHHIDRDTKNDAITNLACISRAAHLDEHRMEIKRAAIR